MPERPSDPRPTVVGPTDGPEAPFPIHLSGPVVQGFGRGSADLGIPTANIPIAGLSVGGHDDMESGIYYGWCGLNVNEDGEQVTSKGTVFEMVMSIGWNPFYGNTKRSVEIHVMHDFKHSFYGARMNLAILGFIRPEYDYVSKDKLIEDIRFDIEVARHSLTRPAYTDLKAEPYLLQFTGTGHAEEIAT